MNAVKIYALFTKLNVYQFNFDLSGFFRLSTCLPSIFNCFAECSSTSSSTPTNNAADETFSISTSTALLTLKAELDYETTQSFHILMTIVDQGISPMLTGSIAVRVNTYIDTI